jgi:hypothetical protein
MSERYQLSNRPQSLAEIIERAAMAIHETVANSAAKFSNSSEC